ncbi:MAG: response regulator [Gammaproteobacteria bacterium]|nr:response regulator [Gammaproteobacteria bacterium]MDH5729673.1 response regulator [Gammaproteobacteria bacterium]
MIKVLSVDDSRVIRELVESVLKNAGYAVTSAEDGLAALELARKEKFDLVLADINMPRMDGIGMVSRLRKIDGYEFIPMIMITTESGEDKKLKAKNLGATGWMTKPFTPERLLAAVKKLVG